MSNLSTFFGAAGGACVEVFTTSGTYTKPDSANFVFVEVYGAGGGGGGTAGGSPNNNPSPQCGVSGGRGGVGGQYLSGFFNASSLSPTVPVTIGAGGAGGAERNFPPTTPTGIYSAPPGAAGGSSCFGNFIESPGGPGQSGDQLFYPANGYPVRPLNCALGVPGIFGPAPSGVRFLPEGFGAAPACVVNGRGGFKGGSAGGSGGGISQTCCCVDGGDGGVPGQISPTGSIACGGGGGAGGCSIPDVTGDPGCLLQACPGSPGAGPSGTGNCGGGGGGAARPDDKQPGFGGDGGYASGGGGAGGTRAGFYPSSGCPLSPGGDGGPGCVIVYTW